jgi:uncharacterized protein DUF1918
VDALLNELRSRQTREGVRLMLKVGDRVAAESESTDRPARTGVIEEVVEADPKPRYRIRWDDGHETIYSPSAGALHPVEPPKAGSPRSS